MRTHILDCVWRPTNRRSKQNRDKLLRFENGGTGWQNANDECGRC
jgi:hypothetical protein